MTLRQLDVGADGELADAIASSRRCACSVQNASSSSLLSSAPRPAGSSRSRTVSGVVLEAAEPLAQIVADDAVDDEGAVDFAGRREDLAAGQVAPLVRTDQAARLDPAIVGIERRRGSRCPPPSWRESSRADRTMLEHAGAEPIDLVIVRAHPFEHDLPVDVHHVRVPHAPAIDDVGQLHAGAELVRLHVHGEDADVAPLHVRGDRRAAGSVERPRRDVLEHERAYTARRPRRSRAPGWRRSPRIRDR